MSSLIDTSVKSRPRFHRNAYQFVFAALQHTQEKSGRTAAHTFNDADAHITGQELCLGLRDLALQKFGLLSRMVLEQWGVKSTGDIGQIVFELIERGEMRKTDNDLLEDFVDVYEFETAFDGGYKIDVGKAFRDVQND